MRVFFKRAQMHQDLILNTTCRKSRQLRPFVRRERFDRFDQSDRPDGDQIFQIFSWSDKKLNYRLMASSLRAKVLASLFFVDSPVIAASQLIPV